MDTQKQLELVKTRNADLAKMVEDLKDQLNFDRTYNSESTKKAKALIIELEKIKQEWDEEIDELNHLEDEYVCLIDELKRMKSLMQEQIDKMGISEDKKFSTRIKNK